MDVMSSVNVDLGYTGLTAKLLEDYSLQGRFWTKMDSSNMS